MAGRKRAASTSVDVTTSTRRQTRRVGKPVVSYQETDDDENEASDDDGEFNGNQSEVESEHAASADEEAGSKDADEDDDGGEELDDFEKDLKKKGYKRVKGKGGKWEMVIDLPKARDDGGTPYEDKRIHPNTLRFLKDLGKHNNREWFQFNKAVYDQANEDFRSFVNELSTIVLEKDATLPELPMKDLMFRIYRDVRFSKDKTPYKNSFSLTWSRTGRKGPYAHYFFRVQPGRSMFGAGYFDIDTLTCNCLREDIDQQPHQFKSILMNDRFRQAFFPGVKANEDKVVAAFVKMSGNNALKTKPKGYDADHQDIALLKLRKYFVYRDISDEEVTSKDAITMIGDLVEAAEPFITYMNDVVMPDR